MEATRKKTLALFMCVSMLAVALVGGTMAYLTDTDSDVNVMTVGNVKIEQLELQRNADGDALERFEQGKKLLPAIFYDENGQVVAPDETLEDGFDVPTWGLASYPQIKGNDDTSTNLLDKSIANEIDKIVSVYNNGSESAYVRTVFLMEDAVLDEAGTIDQGKYLTDYMMFAWTENGGQNSGNYNVVKDADGNKVLVEIDGTQYSIQVHYYENVLAPGETTASSLKQFYLDPNATNDFQKIVGKEYTIMALSQAVQKEGFVDDRTALDAAFGSATAENVVAWFEGKEFETPALVDNAEDLAAELSAGNNVALTGNVEAADVAVGSGASLDLNGKTLTGNVVVNGGKVAVENGFVANTNSTVSGIQINGGEAVLSNTEITSARHAVRVEGTATVTIDDGTYKVANLDGKTVHALNVSDGGKVVINGGTFVGPKGTAADSGAAVNVQANSTVIINGGDFSGGKNNTLSGKGTLVIYGGTFDQDPSAYVADGYKATQNGSVWTVAKA